MSDLRSAAEHALRVLDEVALDLATDQLSQYREMYKGGYKPHRIKAAEDDLMAVQNTIAQLKDALGKQDDAVNELLKVQGGPFKGKPQQWFTRVDVERIVASVANLYVPLFSPGEHSKQFTVRLEALGKQDEGKT